MQNWAACEKFQRLFRLILHCHSYLLWFFILFCELLINNPQHNQLNAHAFSGLSVLNLYELLPHCFSFHLEWLQNTKVIRLFHYLQNSGRWSKLHLTLSSLFLFFLSLNSATCSLTLMHVHMWKMWLHLSNCTLSVLLRLSYSIFLSTLYFSFDWSYVKNDRI